MNTRTALDYIRKQISSNVTQCLPGYRTEEHKNESLRDAVTGECGAIQPFARAMAVKDEFQALYTHFYAEIGGHEESSRAKMVNKIPNNSTYRSATTNISNLPHSRDKRSQIILFIGKTKYGKGPTERFYKKSRQRQGQSTFYEKLCFNCKIPNHLVAECLVQKQRQIEFKFT